MTYLIHDILGKSLQYLTPKAVDIVTDYLMSGVCPSIEAKIEANTEVILLKKDSFRLWEQIGGWLFRGAKEPFDTSWTTYLLREAAYDHHNP
jgi:hypothetical protein